MKWVFAILVAVFLLLPTFQSAQAWSSWGRPGWGWGHHGFYPYAPFPRYYYRPYYPRYYPAYYGWGGYYPYGAPYYYGGAPGIYFSSPGITVGVGPGW